MYVICKDAILQKLPDNW